jgi:hypothetical protein
VLLLLLLSLAVIGGIVVSALGGPQAISTLGHLTANLSITPRHQDIPNNYLISGVIGGTTDATKRQVDARTITAQSDTKQGTGHATGSQAAKQATGVLRFINTNAASTTLASTVITGSDGVQVTFNGPITVPANPPFLDVNAYAVNLGAAGNIPALDINKGCCSGGITVRNSAAFTGGKNAIPNSLILSSDITNAENPLIGQLKTSTQADLQKLMKSNERVVDNTFQCTPKTSADHNAGDIVSTFTVMVSVACSEDVYDLVAAEQMAQGLLPTNLPSGVDIKGYAPVGQVQTSLVSATQVSQPGQVSINILASGRWVYQFTSALQQQIKQAIANKSEAVAKSILRQYTGIDSYTLNISSGSTMPANINDINLTIQPISGLQPSTPTTTSSTPGGGVVPTSTSGSSTPGAKPTGTPTLGGS